MEQKNCLGEVYYDFSRRTEIGDRSGKTDKRSDLKRDEK